MIFVMKNMPLGHFCYNDHLDRIDQSAVHYPHAMGALSKIFRARGATSRSALKNSLGLLMNLEDIAKKAGVSRATVSRVINNAPNVNANTREQVWEIIRRENFQPDPAARALVRRKTEIIGVVVPTEENIFFTDNNYFTQILAGVSQVTRDRDYGMLLWLGAMMDDERLMQ